MSDRSFIESWSLDVDDIAFVEGFNLVSRVWVAFQLRFFRTHGRFPSREDDSCPESLRYLGRQLDLAAPGSGRFRFHHVNTRRHRAAILRHLGVRRASERDRSSLRAWLVEECRRTCGAVEDQVAAGYAWCLGRSIYVASDKIMERLVRGARHDFLEGLLTSIARDLPANTRAKLEASLCEPAGPTGFHRLKDDVGAASLESVLSACDRLAFVEGLDLPVERLGGVDPAWVALLSRRVEGETGSEMRRHGETRRLGLYALYLMDRRRTMVDGLVDLLLEIVHRLRTRSRRKVIGAIARDIERVHGKERLLVDIAEAAVDDPQGRVVDVIYPVAGVAKLTAVIAEHHAKGTMDRRIQTVMRGSYASHYGVGCGKGRNDTPSEKSMFGRREGAAPKRAQVPCLTVRRHQAESGERYAFHSDPYPAGHEHQTYGGVDSGRGVAR